MSEHSTSVIGSARKALCAIFNVITDTGGNLADLSTGFGYNAKVFKAQSQADAILALSVLDAKTTHALYEAQDKYRLPEGEDTAERLDQIQRVIEQKRVLLNS